MRSNLTGYLVAVALGVALAREHNRRRREEARAVRLESAGVVDLEPMVEATEDMVAALRLNGTCCHRSADVVSIPVRP